jgi:hypothetical protein
MQTNYLMRWRGGDCESNLCVTIFTLHSDVWIAKVMSSNIPNCQVHKPKFQAFKLNDIYKYQQKLSSKKSYPI